MRLEKIFLENFRGYKDRVVVNIDSLTAFIGKNDTGKSSFLEALNIFFNGEIKGSNVKFEFQDKCVFCNNEETIIGCVFSDIPHEVVLDDSVLTSFESEYLLNENGLLEIEKHYGVSATPSVFIRAIHPSNTGFENLHTKKNKDLKTLVQKYKIHDVVNLTTNSEMRKALWEHLGDTLECNDKLITIDKDIAANIQRLYPKYALFKADRPSTDEDSEAQDPINLAVKKALESQKVELDKIKSTVMTYVESVASDTIEKLKEFDEQVASQLSPNFKKEPSWDKAFSFSMTGDDSIPINKRGSGIRRLVLFSFFRANIENEYDIDNGNGIIYAVEEPETSQHPDFQKVVVETFLKMIENPYCQVILTTHVPGLAGLLPSNSLRHVVLSGQTRSIFDTANSNSEFLLESIANTLGVYPSISTEVVSSQQIKIIICVEGPNDVQFFHVLCKQLHNEDANIIDIKETDSILILPMGGGTLQHWVDYNYLTKLNIPEYHIYDRDDNSKYQQFCDVVNSRGTSSSARLTTKRETENYIHPKAIEKTFGFSLHVDSNTNVPEEISKILKVNNQPNSSESKVKVKLNNDAVSYMTLELLRESDPDNDILRWLSEIKSYL